MKTITKLILGILLFSFNYSQAQEQLETVDVSNTASPYKYEEVRYYYFPNMMAYYDTKVGMYLYIEDGYVVESEVLDTKAKGYSYKNGQYVVIKDYIGDDPFTLIAEHRKTYPADYSSRPKKPTQNAATVAIHNTQSLASND